MSVHNLAPQRIDTPSGRYYDTPFGTFPSVTTILAATRSPSKTATLENWKARTFDHEGIVRRACERGTYLHGRIERHLNNLPPENFSEKEKELAVPHVWKSVQGHLRRIHNPLFIEACVYDPTNKYAGTLDLLESNSLAECELWDWKNREERIRNEEYIEDYYCQVAAYAKAAPKCLPGVPSIVRARIVICLTKEPAQEFLMTEKKLDYYYRYFLRRLAKFRTLGKEFSFTPPAKPTRRRPRK